VPRPMTDHGAPSAATTSMRSLAWKRRRLTIPVMLMASGVAIIAAPVVIPILVLIDAFRRRRRLPTVRVYLFLLQYGFNDSIEILLAGPLWIIAGFGSRLSSVGSLRRHDRLQSWSIRSLARRADQLLGVTFSMAHDDAQLISRGGAVVICRHVNLFDASLPSLLFDRHGVASRAAIMAELLQDPGFDLIYQRTGSVFITRDGAPESILKLHNLGQSINDHSVAVIFPEGRLFRQDVLTARLERLKVTNPIRYDRLQTLKYSLPPRPAGFLELLRASTSSDVAVINHVGFEDLGGFKLLMQNAPLNKSIEVTASRFARQDLPQSDDELIEWLDNMWIRLDAQVHATMNHSGDSTS
jgi:hypothetical protein